MSLHTVSATPAPWTTPSAAHGAAAAEVRWARPYDVHAVYALVDSHVESGHLLPRSREEIAAHIGRFVVAVRGDEVIGCAELARLSGAVAEIRSLVVSEEARGAGVGRGLVSAIVAAARPASYGRLCAFTHDPGFFVRMGFSLVAHLELPEKIAADCVRCPLFRRCGQHAVLLPLPAAEVHG